MSNFDKSEDDLADRTCAAALFADLGVIMQVVYGQHCSEQCA